MDTSPGSRTAKTAYILISALLLITLAIGIVEASQRVIGMALGEYRLSVPVSAIADIELPPDFQVAGTVPLRAVIEDASPSQLVITTVAPALWWAGVVAILWLIRGVARSAREGDPFRVSNVRRLRRLGLLFLIGYPLIVIVDGFMTNLLFSLAWPEGKPFPDVVIPFQVLSGTALLAGVSLLVLAEVFAQGVRMREDVDATV